MVILEKMKQLLNDPAISLMVIYPKEVKAGLEITQIPIDGWMDKQNMMYTM